MFCLLDKAGNPVPNYTQSTTSWEYSITALLVLAEKHRCQSLKQDCIEYLRYPPALDVVMAFGDSFDHVTQNCPALLRELWDVLFENDPIQDELALSL
ncbi:hypothetical protein EJB05_56820, partial [Eragrostis curvula]